jgi:hypothetical protein
MEIDEYLRTQIPENMKQELIHQIEKSMISDENKKILIKKLTG